MDVTAAPEPTQEPHQLAPSAGPPLGDKFKRTLGTPSGDEPSEDFDNFWFPKDPIELLSALGATLAKRFKLFRSDIDNESVSYLLQRAI